MTGLLNSFKNLFSTNNNNPNDQTTQNTNSEENIEYQTYKTKQAINDVAINQEFNLDKQNQTLILSNNSMAYIDDNDLGSSFEGTGIITDYCFHFRSKSSDDSGKEIKPIKIIKIPLFIISKLLIEEKDKGNVFIFDIITKDNRHERFKSTIENKKFYSTLQSMAFRKKTNSEFIIYAKKYALIEKYSECKLERKLNGWYLYNPEDDFDRMGLDKQRFQVGKINEGYSICQTYPEILATPLSMKKEKIMEAANFRTKNRFPIVCWYNKEAKTTLLRSSQTKSGFNIGNFNRSESDETYLEQIREENEFLDIFDARPYLNAFANKFKGAGFENTNNYKNTRITFCEIENIHFVRGCFEKMHKLLGNPRLWDDKNYYSGLENTGWMEMTSIILSKTVDICNSLQKNSVLIHCSDGWDRTAQLTSLTQLLLDPYYRTIRGFCVLIEKEWVSFGHMFAYRSGFHIEELSENNYSPVFIQFLDCVYQLILQFPDKFEFNINMLEFLAYHVYTGRYGTFLFNNERDRNQVKAKETTVSIWTDVLYKSNKKLRKSFYNPDYNENTDLTILDYIIPTTYIFKLELWVEYFLRYNPINDTNLGYWSSGEKKDNWYMNSNTFYIEEKREMLQEIKKKEEKNLQLISAINDLIKNGELNESDLELINEYEEVKHLLK